MVKCCKFKMSSINKYENYKKEYENYIVLIREGAFYKTFDKDALILWSILNYKLNNNSLSFSLSVSNKVFDALHLKDIGYVIISDDILKVSGNAEVYGLHEKLALYYYDKYTKKNELSAMLDKILDDDSNYEKVCNFFSELIIK